MKNTKVSPEVIGNKRNKTVNTYSAFPNYSFNQRKDESKMLKYVMKLSEEEYKKSNQQNIKSKYRSVLDIESNSVFYPSEIDFLEFSKYIDSLWNKNSDDGLIKIIPPEKFRQNIKQTYISKIDKILEEDKDKKIVFRIQKLNQLYKSNVSFSLFNFFNNLLFIHFII